MNIERAMFLLFGNFEAAKQHSVWHYIDASSQDKEFNDADKSEVESVIQSKFDPERIYVFSNYKMYAKPVFSKNFQENGLPKFLLVAGSVKDSEGDEDFGESCHHCGVKMSMATFVQKNGIWKFESQSRNLLGEYGGNYGSPPETSLVKIGKDKYAVVFEEGSTGMGLEITTSHYIGRVDGAIKEFSALRTHIR